MTIITTTRNAIFNGNDIAELKQLISTLTHISLQSISPADQLYCSKMPSLLFRKISFLEQQKPVSELISLKLSAVRVEIAFLRQAFIQGHGVSDHQILELYSAADQLFSQLANLQDGYRDEFFDAYMKTYAAIHQLTRAQVRRKVREGNIAHTLIDLHAETDFFFLATAESSPADKARLTREKSAMFDSEANRLRISIRTMPDTPERSLYIFCLIATQDMFLQKASLQPRLSRFIKSLIKENVDLTVKFSHSAESPIQKESLRSSLRARLIEITCVKEKYYLDEVEAAEIDALHDQVAQIQCTTPVSLTTSPPNSRKATSGVQSPQ